MSLLPPASAVLSPAPAQAAPVATPLVTASTVTLAPGDVWEHTISGDAVVGAWCYGPSPQAAYMFMTYQLGSNSPVNQGWCDGGPRFVIRAEGQSVTIRVANTDTSTAWGHQPQSHTVTIDVRSYDDISRPATALPLGAHNELLQPLQHLQQIVSGYEIVSAKCDGTSAQASNIWMYYRVGTGSWNNRGLCDQGANFVERVAGQQVTIDIYNYSDQFGTDRTPFFEVRAYNDIVRPSNAIPLAATRKACDHSSISSR